VQPTLAHSTSRRTGYPKRSVAFSSTATSAVRSGRRDRRWTEAFGKALVVVDQRRHEVLVVR
jgi:hypothetical protein